MLIHSSILELAKKAEESVADEFSFIGQIAHHNQKKVLDAFRRHRISTEHFQYTNGYGYDDAGRDTLDAVYADVFGAEDALVRHHILSGTHALSTALFGVLRPGDTLVSVTGKPYDTLEEVIGISGKAGNGSLKDFGIQYKELPLCDGKIQYDRFPEVFDETTRLVYFQRSKGYEWRPSLTISDLEEAFLKVREICPGAIIMVDNCYGEFTETKEPTEVGADLIAGSLIKNPGGGLAPSGGYIAGRKELIEKISYRLTTVGTGKEVGASLGTLRLMYQGFFMAPHIVAQAMKTSVFCAALFDLLGFPVCPLPKEKRTDLIQIVRFNDSDAVIRFCKGIQMGSPVDSFVTPLPWDMPGYSDPVIMAAGAFVQGSSIEISADAPIREPYQVYMQGGITYESGKIAVLYAAEQVLEGIKNEFIAE